MVTDVTIGQYIPPKNKTRWKLPWTSWDRTKDHCNIHSAMPSRIDNNERVQMWCRRLFEIKIKIRDTFLFPGRRRISLCRGMWQRSDSLCVWIGSADTLLFSGNNNIISRWLLSFLVFCQLLYGKWNYAGGFLWEMVTNNWKYCQHRLSMSDQINKI